MKIISSLIFLTLVLNNCLFFQEKSSCSKGGATVPAFEGLVMFSDDSGTTWIPRKTDLPADFTPASVFVEENSVYMGSNYGNLYRLDNENFATAEKENILTSLPALKPQEFHRVSGIFSGHAGTYVFVDGTGLFYKKQGQSFWQPIQTPDGIFHANEIHEDSDGNIYIVAQHGVFMSPDQGREWQRIFPYGYAHHMILSGGTLLVNGIFGLYSSADKGQSWTHDQNLNILTGDLQNNHSDLFREGLNLYHLKKYEYVGHGPAKKNQLWFSKDGGLSWDVHPANSFLQAQKDIYSLVWFRDTWYCSTREGVFASADQGVTWKLRLTNPGQSSNSGCRIMKAGDRLVCVRMMLGC